MADFVLVHGAWHGAWCWQRVLPGLWRAGHRAWAVSLTGVGERKHLMGPWITLATHVEDVLNVLEAEELRDAVLVGHSYAGMVITGVADLAPERVGQLVYLDAVVPLPGESWSSGHGPETQQQRREQIARQGLLPPADPALYGLQGEDHAWVARRQTPQPGGVYDSPLHFDPQRVSARPRTFVDCTRPALPTIDTSRRRVRSEPGWRVVELETGHDPMVSAPQALLQVLLSLA
ncbi:alpha/beta hydrolase [Caldimonas thermodepolymerans]|jgi:Predicted hydrolases or acyltransferases (alpha/beta hydrolase superfamily)|uniref:Alpha/beta hydrolase n=1 Tax=Caldimonas thermodepolymerans TaxID=215580 RepID=A0A2S5T5F2_9BURK|nr:alpha/beta fold hydrolase [Caldimonas thermodepolymerans]PPE70211.1 alpha/beta hydrolase [Caldimonas thermodepolymerans]QPC32206.1 alpha/beta hydrolase [Caldimonas thermodepolymerans]RDH98094.1 alpha/beta hydrolase family protein [Caldimonas thermodepolymerans]TCP08131.1 alpha/beta hydrolase family protein [Caldimonas thermodepolymerans]UZG45007.1 alpha/beta fold hydrolase [Caldimonas thermodepolymerans]